MAGLENLGLICYSNSVIQCLSNCQEVHDSVRDHFTRHTIPDPTRLCPRCILYSVLDLMTRDPSNPVGMWPLKGFYDALEISLISDGDPREFFVQMVRDYFPEMQTLVGFPLDTSIFCMGCEYTSITSTPSVELELNRNVKNFQEGLDGYLAPEGVAAFDCNRCKTYTDAILTRSLRQMPSYLVLHRTSAAPIGLNFILNIGDAQYLLDSFIELVPSRSSKAPDHYITYKKVRDIWLSYDDTHCKKANLSGKFRVNLAFYRHLHRSKCVMYDLDFAVIKQGRARKKPPPMVKGKGKGTGKKSSVKNKSIDSIASKLGAALSETAATLSTSTPSSSTLDVTLPKVGDSPTENKDSLTSEEQSLPPNNAETDKTTKEKSNTQVEDLRHDKNTEKEPANSDNNQPTLDESNTVCQDLDVTGPVATSSQVDNSDGQLGGLSAEELPPIELSKRLIVDIEKYPNLLKRFQEGKVRTKPTKTEVERLGNIKTKVITKSQFQKYVSKDTDTDKAEESKQPDKPTLSSTEDNSSGSSQEYSEDHDDSDTDPAYDPIKDSVGEDKPKKPKLDPKAKKGRRSARLASTRSTPQVTRTVTNLTKTKAKNKDGKGGKSSDVIHVPRNVRRDGVDERCKRDNIKYLKWVGKKGRGLHRSQVSTKKVLIDYVPKAQDVNADCILCPMEKTLDGKADAIDHYKRVHIAHLLTINNTNMLRCRCSEIRSRGSDNSVRNRHYHCVECWHPFDTGAKIRIHMLSKHSDKYSGSQLAHLKPRSQRN